MESDLIGSGNDSGLLFCLRKCRFPSEKAGVQEGEGPSGRNGRNLGKVRGSEPLFYRGNISDQRYCRDSQLIFVVHHPKFFLKSRDSSGYPEIWIVASEGEL